MKSAKRQKRCMPRCQQHILSIRPISNEAALKQEVHMEFCPNLLPLECIQSRVGMGEENYYPEFNKDGKAHTPAFILGIDKRQYIQNDQSLLIDHNKKVREYEDSPTQIYYPKPSRKHKICSVCRSPYDDYRNHINSESHKKNISNNKFNNEILELCRTLFKNENKIESAVDSDQPQTTAQSNRNSLAELEPKPTKRRKMAEEPIITQQCQWNLPMTTMTQPQFPMFDMMKQWQIQQQLACYYRQFGFGGQAFPTYFTYPPLFSQGIFTNPIVLE